MGVPLVSTSFCMPVLTASVISMSITVRVAMFLEACVLLVKLHVFILVSKQFVPKEEHPCPNRAADDPLLLGACQRHIRELSPTCTGWET